MTFRDAVATTGSNVLTMATTVVGDEVIAIVNSNVSSGITGPAGWTQIGTEHNIPEQGGNYTSLWTLNGGAPSSPPASYTWNAGGVNFAVSGIIASFSGRSLVLTFNQWSQNSGYNSSPYNATYTGGTAAAGDDLVFFTVSTNGSAGDPWVFDAPTCSGATFTHRLEANNGSSGNSVALSTSNNVAAGATGTLTQNIHGGSNVITPGGWLIGLAKASASAPNLFFGSGTTQ